MLSFLASFFTPTYLFLFLNLIIGTIFISSRFTSHPKSQPHEPGPLTRAPSLLDRVKSIDFSFHKFDHHPHPQPDTATHYLPNEFDHRVDAVNNPPLSRNPSLLDRFKSINFYEYKFESPNPDPEPSDSVNSPPLSRAPSLLNRLSSIDFYGRKFCQPIPNPELIHPSDSTPLARAPSPFERVKSINLSSFYKQGQPEAYHEPEHREPNSVRRVRSESERKGGEGSKARMRKTSSEKSTEAAEPKYEEEEIDAKADDFINRFKQQLKLQRLDSIMRYKEMLTGGAAQTH